MISLYNRLDNMN